MKFKVYVDVQVPAEAWFTVEADSLNEAAAKVEADLDEKEWASEYWQDGEFRPIWDSAYDLCFGSVEPHIQQEGNP